MEGDSIILLRQHVILQKNNGYVVLHIKLHGEFSLVMAGHLV